MERFHELGDVEGMMAWRGEKEARLKGFTSFAQYLVGSAFKAAARGFTSEEWIRRVLDWVAHCPKLEDMPWALEAYRVAIASLQASGPWPWPRVES